MNIYAHKRKFTKNKYRFWYYKIIKKAIKQSRTKKDFDYYENHHILPKSLFPEYKNENWNTILLTPKEHFICHLLLTKITKGLFKYKMIKALIMLMNIKNIGNRQIYKVNSRWYEYYRKISKDAVLAYWSDDVREHHSQKLREYNRNVDKKF